MKTEKNEAVVEAEYLWNHMSEDLQAACARNGNQVPRFIKEYHRATSERPSYPMVFFSSISWGLGTLFFVSLLVVTTRVGEPVGMAVRWGLLVFTLAVDLCWCLFLQRHHADYEEELLAWDRKIGCILSDLTDFICLIKGQAKPAVVIDATGDIPKITHTTAEPWLSNDVVNEQLRLLAIRLQESDEGAFDGYLMDLVTEVNRAHKLGVEPISTLGPVNGLRLLLEIASRTDRFNSTSAQSATT